MGENPIINHMMTFYAQAYIHTCGTYYNVIVFSASYNYSMVFCFFFASYFDAYTSLDILWMDQVLDGLGTGSTHTHNLTLAHMTQCIQCNVQWPGGAHTQKQLCSTQLRVGTPDLVCSNKQCDYQRACCLLSKITYSTVSKTVTEQMLIHTITNPIILILYFISQNHCLQESFWMQCDVSYILFQTLNPLHVHLLDQSPVLQLLTFSIFD